jgi:hypothetical protein
MGLTRALCERATADLGRLHLNIRKNWLILRNASPERVGFRGPFVSAAAEVAPLSPHFKADKNSCNTGE